jgi:predicted metal-dependent HD superfamily phosphohydrolase
MTVPPAAPDPTRWTWVWSGLGGRGDGRHVFDQLAAAYTEPARTYHDIQHLRHCLTELEGNMALAHRPIEVEAALWFHDAVYAPARSDNEDRSALLAQTALRAGGVVSDIAGRIGALVLATRHTELALEDDARLICDVDLSILGTQPAAFRLFERAIRQEYRWVPDALYRKGRIEVLRRLLRRRSIYQTAPFQARYENQARQNLEAAVAALSA